MLFYLRWPHEGNEHVCRVVDCSSKPGTACQHIPAKCGNCGGAHPAIAGNCPAKREAIRQSTRRVNTTGETVRQTTDALSPEERASPRDNQTPVAPSSPGFTFTVVTQNQPNPQVRSNSVPTSPHTPQPTSQREDMEMRDTHIPGKPDTHQC